ncbi:MAG TPA: DUF4232 domain-containing protein [Chloroflexota bacterium]|nr:DUF4232 domain-containing protein [Chloroflexota bacterium]
MITRLMATGIIAGLLLLALTPLRQVVAASHSMASTSRCQNIQLSIRPASIHGATGHVGAVYRLHNTWSTPCSLQGYPGVELLDAQFHSLPTHTNRGHGFIIYGTPPAPRVTLDAAHDAYFGLEYSDVQTQGETCPRTEYLLVIPPDDYLPDVTYSHAGTNFGYVAPCGGKVTVSPVHGTATVR